MTHAEYTKRLSEALDNLTFIVLKFNYGTSSAETKAEQFKAQQAINQLVLEVVDYDIEEWANSNSHYGVEKEVRYEVRDEQLQIVKGETHSSQ